MLSQIPRFNEARRYGQMLLAVGALFAVLGAVLLVFALAQRWLPGTEASRALGYLGSALWTAAAGFLSAAILVIARQRLLDDEVDRREPPEATPEQSATATSRLADRLAAWRRAHLEIWRWDAERLARWPPALVSLLFGLSALAGIRAVWRLPSGPAFDAVSLQITGAALVVAAFPLLVLQRIYATTQTGWLPEAPQLDRLLRVPLTACIGLATALVLISVGFVWAIPIERVIALLIFVVALELIVRTAALIFIPFAPIAHRQSLADSSLAGGLLRLGVPNLKAINIVVRRQLGIDLSRSWALGFIQKAALPVLVGIALFAWGVTGVTALSIDERGIYERFGVPVAVFGPGLHLHLPWPFGRIRSVEIGVVHLLPIEFLLPGGENTGKSSSVGVDEERQQVGAEAPAPESADRLWTDDHPFEGNYIIASAEHGKQSFQLVDIDMAVMYRVGLSERAARDAAYRVTDVDELIQAVSGQLLVRYFSRNTLLDLLGRSRATFTKQFQTALQKELDRFSTGVEAIGVSVEAIHPPPGAANAYHGVQAAEIRANTQISVRRGQAIATVMTAQRAVAASRNEALASAAERGGQAQSQSVVFAGDRQAYAKDGYAFLLERWLASLTKGLGQSEVVLIDHRLSGRSVPALDLRDLRDLSTGDVVPATSPNPQSPDEDHP